MVSNGSKLIVNPDIDLLAMCKSILKGLSILAIVVFFVSILVHKMIGVELIHPLQVIYIIHLTTNDTY